MASNNVLVMAHLLSRLQRVQLRPWFIAPKDRQVGRRHTPELEEIPLIHLLRRYARIVTTLAMTQMVLV